MAKNRRLGEDGVKQRSLAMELKNNYQLIIMAVPAIVFFLVFSYLPMTGIYFAFTNYNFRDGLWKSPFVGLKNFEFLFSSGTLANLTKNTLLYNLAFIGTTTIGAIIVAIILNDLRHKKFKKITQTLIFLPYFISWVLVSAFVYNIGNYEYGVLNTMLKSWGMEPVNIYIDPGIWKYVLVGLNLWKQLGYSSVIYLATITGIDEAVNEAADIDGANIFQRIRYITIPHLIPTFIIQLIFNIGHIMKGQFDMFFNVIGNNGLLFNATDIIDTFVYRSLKVNFDMGMASAAGVYQSIFGLIIVMSVNALIRKIKPEYALF